MMKFMLRHLTRSLFERRDVIVVASISCIYGPGIPAEYLKAAIPKMGMEVNQRQILRDLASVQYSRNDLEIGRGRFRVGVTYWRLVLTKTELSGWNSFDEIDAIRYVDPVTGGKPEALSIYPLCHTRGEAAQCIEQELQSQRGE